MSHATALALVAALDAFVIAALAAVCLIPFRIDLPTRAAQTTRSRVVTELEPNADAA